MLMKILVVMIASMLGTGHPVYLPICPLWWLAADYGPERPGIMTLLAGQDVHMQCALSGRALESKAAPTQGTIAFILGRHSTVTLFARFRGLSTSNPLARLT